jgi:hypothetical protein
MLDAHLFVSVKDSRDWCGEWNWQGRCCHPLFSMYFSDFSSLVVQAVVEKLLEEGKVSPIYLAPSNSFRILYLPLTPSSSFLPPLLLFPFLQLILAPPPTIMRLGLG